jgi:hypothetical protein
MVIADKMRSLLHDKLPPGFSARSADDLLVGLNLITLKSYC